MYKVDYNVLEGRDVGRFVLDDQELAPTQKQWTPRNNIHQSILRSSLELALNSNLSTLAIVYSTIDYLAPCSV